LAKSAQIQLQHQNQRGRKLYSWHRPETEMHRQEQGAQPYEAGCKVSITTNRRCEGGQFVLHAKAFQGNPYDGHTLKQVSEETQALMAERSTDLHRQGVPRPQGAQAAQGVPIKAVPWHHRPYKARTPMTRAIDPVIGHMKSDGHLDRNFLRWLRPIFCLIIHRIRVALVRSAAMEHPPQALLLAS